MNFKGGVTFWKEVEYLMGYQESKEQDNPYLLTLCILKCDSNFGNLLRY